MYQCVETLQTQFFEWMAFFLRQSHRPLRSVQAPSIDVHVDTLLMNEYGMGSYLDQEKEAAIDE